MKNCVDWVSVKYNHSRDRLTHRHGGGAVLAVVVEAGVVVVMVL